MSPDQTRKKLIEGTIRVIARDGLEKVTTKSIGVETSINEAYIYRCFGSKEELLAASFDVLDEELFAKTMQYIEVMYNQGIEFEMRCRFYFYAVWSFLLGSHDKCLAYIRYFYSPQFTKYSAEAHEKRFLPLVAKFKDAFKEDANVWLILNHILNVMLDFAFKVHIGQMPKEDNYAEHIFRVTYASIAQYFRN